MAKTVDTGVRDLDAVVIGAGFAGLYAVYRLRELGFSVHGYEKGNGVGGAWYWNRYPGCRCDVESTVYSYSFLTEFEQQWPIKERFPAQPDILKYLEAAAEHMDVVKDFTFSTHIARLEFDETAERWIVLSPQGVVATAQYVVTAVGCLSAANRPSIPGIGSFDGEVYHTGEWPHDPVDFTGKRVGVIGTGSSGIQTIPEIAKTAGHLTVFQRTAQFTTPAGNGPLDEEYVKLWKANYPEWRRRSRESAGGLPLPFPARSALSVTDEERQRVYEAGWQAGGPDFLLGSFGDIMTDEDANATAADFVRAKIDQIVHDPETARKLKPTYPLGAKRPPVDTHYYATFNRPNVSLVDLKATPIEEIVPQGIRTGDDIHELDAIVFATGYDALTGALLAMDIRGRGGRPLTDAWADGYESYLGLAAPAFPNLFTITGPGSPSVMVVMPVGIEHHVGWIANCLAALRDRGARSIEANPGAARDWTAHVQEVASQTLYAKTASWFSGANVPGKPQQFLPFAGGFTAYKAKCDDVVARDYIGFDIADPEPVAENDQMPTLTHIGG